MRVSSILTTSLLLALPLANASWEDNFSSCTWATLYQYMPPDCLDASGTFVGDQAGNACLCPLETYITDVAQHVWGYCGCDVLNRTAGTYVSICNSTSTPAPYTPAQIVSIGCGQTTGCVEKTIVSASAVNANTAQPTGTPTQAASASRTTTPSVTQGPTASPTSSSQRSSGWSDNQIIGTSLGTGSLVVGILGLLAALEIIGKRKERPELRPTYQINRAYHYVNNLTLARNHMSVHVPMENLHGLPENVV